MRKVTTTMAGKMFIGLFLAFTCLCAFGTAAAEYPEKPIKLVVPYPPGGQTDITARIIVSASSAYLPQPFTISNVGGAGGSIGSAEVARAKADGYTLLMGANATNTYIPLSQKVPYSKDSFVPIAQLSASPTILAVNAASPYKTLKDFIAAAKKGTECPQIQHGRRLFRTPYPRRPFRPEGGDQDQAYSLCRGPTGPDGSIGKPRGYEPELSRAPGFADSGGAGPAPGRHLG